MHLCTGASNHSSKHDLVPILVFVICCDIFFSYAFMYCVVLGSRLFVDGFQIGLIIGNSFFAGLSLLYRFHCTAVVFPAYVAAVVPRG